MHFVCISLLLLPVALPRMQGLALHHIKTLCRLCHLHILTQTPFCRFLGMLKHVCTNASDYIVVKFARMLLLFAVCAATHAKLYLPCQASCLGQYLCSIAVLFAQTLFCSIAMCAATHARPSSPCQASCLGQYLCSIAILFAQTLFCSFAMCAATHARPSSPCQASCLGQYLCSIAVLFAQTLFCSIAMCAAAHARPSSPCQASCLGQ